MSSVARSRLILALILLVIIAAVWRMRRAPQPTSVAYVADPSATLWNTTALVRQPVAEVGYGEQVVVLRRSGDQTEVRTADGAQGWVETRLLMDSSLWQKGAALVALARTLPVQANGHTRTISNVHLEPGRDTPRIFQFGRDVPVIVLERAVMPIPAAPTSEGSPAEDSTPVNQPDDSTKPKMEDWLFISRSQPEKSSSASASSGPAPADPGAAEDEREVPIAGWVLGRFIELDPPAPIPDYSTAAGMRVVAWAELNTVQDASGEKAQYLVAGTRGPEGAPCDFTSLRVYTWGATRQQYETAYVENDLCGMLPIRTSQTATGPEFRFAEGGRPSVDRVYRMNDTIVRRVNETDTAFRNRRR